MNVHAQMCLIGLTSGGAVAAGSFAFLLVIGILPRWLGYFKLEKHILLAEDFMALGIACGAVLSVLPEDCTLLSVSHGITHIWVGISGLGFGIFVGCMAAALSEILHTFPVLFRRLRIKEGLPWVVVCMAFGKMAGALFYFLCGYSQTG